MRIDMRSGNITPLSFPGTAIIGKRREVCVFWAVLLDELFLTISAWATSPWIHAR
jgi:hypothetical protein